MHIHMCIYIYIYIHMIAYIHKYTLVCCSCVQVCKEGKRVLGRISKNITSCLMALGLGQMKKGRSVLEFVGLNGEMSQTVQQMAAGVTPFDIIVCLLRERFA